MKYLLTMIMAIIITAIQAQVPGYLGKRFSLFFDANPTPAFLVQNTNNSIIVRSRDESAYSARNNPFAFNFRPQLEVDYLIHRDFSLGLLVNYIMIGTATAADLDDAINEPTRVVSGGAVKGAAAGVRLKFFRYRKSSSIAPIGLYKTISISAVRVNAFENFSSPSPLLSGNIYAPVVSFGIGRQSMFAKNFLVKTGLEFGFAGVPFDFLTESDDDWTAQEYTRNNLYKSLFAYSLFSLNIAIGYIPF
jgi:hypothetical protein